MRAIRNMGFPAEKIQGVCFIEAGARPDDAIKMWGALFEDDGPDGFQRPSNSPNLQSTATGLRNGFTVTLGVQIGRVDLVLTAIPQDFSNPQMQSPVTIAPDKVADATAFVVGKMKKIAGKLHATRLAVVLETIKVVLPGEDSAALRQELSSLELPEGSTDIALQLNVRKEYGTSPRILLNRLIAWSSAQLGFVSAGFGGITSVRHVASVRIDINTVPEYRIPEGDHDSALEVIEKEALHLYVKGLTGLQDDG